MPLTADDRRVWFQRHARPGFKDWETYAADLERRIEDLVARMRVVVVQRSERAFIFPEREITSPTYTLRAQDAEYTLAFNSTSAQTLTVPPDLVPSYPQRLFQKNTGQLTIAAGDGVTIHGAETLLLRTQYSPAELSWLAANTWLLSSDPELT